MENILYGKLDATNSQLLAAAELSNCVEFIDKKEAQKQESSEESANMLKNQFLHNQDQLIALIGKEKFDEEIEVLTKIEE